MASYLAEASYGKDKVRVFRVVREGKVHHIVEYNVQVLLEGELDTSYTQADNSVVVATDSIKNITYYFSAHSKRREIWFTPRDSSRFQVRSHPQGTRDYRAAPVGKNHGRRETA